VARKDTAIDERAAALDDAEHALEDAMEACELAADVMENGLLHERLMSISTLMDMVREQCLRSRRSMIGTDDE
jgi:hypothetical protein